MQNAGIAALGLNWRYLAFDTHPDHLRDALAGARVMKFIGLNLTVPHKLLAMALVDQLDETAKTWGAVNTIRFEGRRQDGQWAPLASFAEDVPDEIRSTGFNTDADAIGRSLREDLRMTLPGSSVLLLGAGGAGRVAALKLAAEGVSSLFLANRTAAKANEVAEAIRQRHPEVTVSVGYPRKPIDLVVNATSLGLKSGDPLPYDQSAFSPSRAGAAYDMIYRPSETPFLKLARAAGCRAANGLGMLLRQGVRALELWSGLPAPVAIMRQALEKHLHER